MDTFAEGGPGARIRLTGANGEVVEGTAVLSYDFGDESIFDTGVQFDAVEPPEGACEFSPPADVYDEGWGGIDGVRWMLNTWGEPTESEISEGCADSSASCLLLAGFNTGAGAHMTYRNPFPIETFTTLELQVRTQSGSGELNIAPRNDDGRCDNTTDAVIGAEWTQIEIDLTSSCPGEHELTGLTISHPTEAFDLVLDEIRFR